MKIKILFIIDSLSIGGAERQFVELLKGVVKIPWIEPFVVYFHESKSPFELQLKSMKIEVVYIKRSSKFDLFLPFRVLVYARNNGIHIIHSFSILASTIAVTVGKFGGIPVIASAIRDGCDPNWKVRVSIVYQAFLATILVSNSLIGLKNRFKKITPKFRVIYNGIDSSRFINYKDNKDAMCASLSLSKYTNVVVMIASLSVYKDHNTIIDSIPIVLDKHPSTVFLLVGDGSERIRLEEKVKLKCINDNVIFTGYVNDVVGILANSDVSVLITNTRIILEGISNALLESMAMGVPIVANRGGGTDEVVEHNRNGLLIDSHNPNQVAEAILYFLDNPKVKRQFGEFGKSIVNKKFNYEKFIGEYASIYKIYYNSLCIKI